MGNKYRKPPSDLIRSQLEIQDRIGLLESTPRATSTSVDTGHFRFKASNGVTMVDFGDQGPGLGRGYVFRRGEGGEPAFYLGNNQATGTQFWALADNSANIIMSDDAQSSQGLARPYIPYMAVSAIDSAQSTLSVTTTSATFVKAFEFHGPKQHPRIDVQYLLNVPAGLTAQIQLVDTTSTALVIAGPVTASFGFGIAGLVGPVVGAHMDDIDVELQFRVASGAGTIGITVLHSLGVQS